MKIALIGAGSGAFSLSLIRDICLTPSLKGCTVSFMDINPDRLEGSYALCRRYAAELGVHLEFEKTLDRQESLSGADYVINTALAAGHHRLRAGWEIARRYGYRWGGSLAIMHDEAFWINFYQFRLFESLAQDILRICPQAWYLQVANPVFGGVTLLSRKYPALKMVGLCHGFSGVYHVASLLGLGRDGLDFEVAGVNHFLWLTRLTYQGANQLPRFAEWVEKESEAYFQTCSEGDHMGPKPVDIYRRLGAVPIGDTATAGGGAWGWWYHRDAETEKRWKENPGKFWEWYFDWVEGNARENLRVSRDANARMTDYLKPVKSGEQIVPLIEALETGEQRICIVNIPNRGKFLAGVPEDIAVEIPAWVDQGAVRGIPTRELPPAVLAYLLRDRVAPVELELAAYLAGSRRLLEELIMLDPWTTSQHQARQFLDEILAMEEHQEMKSHYRLVG